MPESKVRDSAASKRKAKDKVELTKKQANQRRLHGPVDRSWVPWVFIPVGLLGVAWLVVYYIAGQHIGFLAALRNWNILIGMGLMAASFAIATLWK